MTKILIGYGTTEGQTAKIADHLAKAIRSRGFDVDAVDLKQSKDVRLPGYDAVIVGERYVMKRIVRDKPGMSTDTSRDYVYTDWDQVTRFAEDFAERLVPKDTAQPQT
jgi:menaquinone-dependent protoporphyrinogen IX oxidase